MASDCSARSTLYARNLAQADNLICVHLAYLNHLSASWINEDLLEAPATGDTKQAQLPFADLAGQKLQHLLRVFAAIPLGLGHRILLPQSCRAADGPSSLRHRLWRKYTCASFPVHGRI